MYGLILGNFYWGDTHLPSKALWMTFYYRDFANYSVFHSKCPVPSFTFTREFKMYKCFFNSLKQCLFGWHTLKEVIKACSAVMATLDMRLKLGSLHSKSHLQESFKWKCLLCFEFPFSSTKNYLKIAPKVEVLKSSFLSLSLWKWGKTFL